MSAPVSTGQHPLRQAAFGTLATRLDLGEALQRRGESTRADAMLCAVHAALGEKPGPRHPDVARALTALARGHLESQRWAEAERSLAKARAILDERCPDHWARFEVESLLGESLLGRGEFTEAEPHLVQGCQGLKKWEKALGHKHRRSPLKGRLSEVLERLVQLYDAWGKPDETAKWRKELEDRKKEK